VKTLATVGPRRTCSTQFRPLFDDYGINLSVYISSLTIKTLQYTPHVDPQREPN
jgi:hypothetical protein